MHQSEINPTGTDIEETDIQGEDEEQVA